MKKISKSKLLLAVLAVTLVASMALAGTYSWFVKTGTAEVDGDGAASVQAAYITLEVDDAKGAFEIDTFSPYYALATGNYTDLLKTGEIDLDDIGTTDMPAIPLVNGTYLLYPGDAIRVTFDISDIDAFVDNNRDVIVGIDASAIVDAFDNAVDFATSNLVFEAVGTEGQSGSLCYEDIINNFDSTGLLADGMYYFYVPAGGDKITLGGIGFVAELGIIGVNRNQNHYMNEGGALAVDADDLSVNVTVAQATKQAVLDVFGKDLDNLMLDIAKAQLKAAQAALANALASAPTGFSAAGIANGIIRATVNSLNLTGDPITITDDNGVTGPKAINDMTLAEIENVIANINNVIGQIRY